MFSYLMASLLFHYFPGVMNTKHSENLPAWTYISKIGLAQVTSRHHTKTCVMSEKTAKTTDIPCVCWWNTTTIKVSSLSGNEGSIWAVAQRWVSGELGEADQGFIFLCVVGTKWLLPMGYWPHVPPAQSTSWGHQLSPRVSPPHTTRVRGGVTNTFPWPVNPAPRGTIGAVLSITAMLASLPGYRAKFSRL